MRTLRRLLGSRQVSLHKKLRKAVVHGKLRQVADLLEAGASPTWMDDSANASDEMHALLLACHAGRVAILDLVLDAFFGTPYVLQLWGRHMYCVVIRNGHWEAFRRLYDRHVPLDPICSEETRLPAPAFIAAESGQSRMLQFLVKHHPIDAAGYVFHGHSLLSIASKNGHYECVEVLLGVIMVTDDMLDFAMDVARTKSQAHVLVLLTSCLPEYTSRSTPFVVSRPSVTFTLDKDAPRDSLVKPRRSSATQAPHRGSLAETDILSDFGDERGSTLSQQPRRSSATWLYQTEQDLNVYHPYVESDDDDEMAQDARQYAAYLQAIDDAGESESNWTSTPPVPYHTETSRRWARSLESEEKTEETLARIAERRETIKKTTEKTEKKPRTWFYHNEVILPYDENESSVTTASATPHNSPPSPAPLSAKPPLPPPTKTTLSNSFQLPPTITQVSRKVISLRSNSLPESRASM